MAQDKFDQMTPEEYEEACRIAIHPYITEEADTCSYCDRIEPLILTEGIRTYITLALGQIIPGYLQITPKKHRTSIAGLLDEEIEEFAQMKQIVRDVYEEVYGTPGVAFEHGKVGACMFRQKETYDEQRASLCHHMHTHFVPADIDIRPDVRMILPDSISVHSPMEVKRLRQGELTGEPYLYFETTEGIGYVYPVDDTSVVPRQFLRSTIATALHVPERADWFEHPGLEHFYSGRHALKDRLNKLVTQRITNE